MHDISFSIDFPHILFKKNHSPNKKLILLYFSNKFIVFVSWCHNVWIRFRWFFPVMVDQNICLHIVKYPWAFLKVLWIRIQRSYFEVMDVFLNKFHYWLCIELFYHRVILFAPLLILLYQQYHVDCIVFHDHTYFEYDNCKVIVVIMLFVLGCSFFLLVRG